MLGHVIRAVEATFLPVDAEVALADAVSEPVEPHINGFHQRVKKFKFSMLRQTFLSYHAENLVRASRIILIFSCVFYLESFNVLCVDRQYF